MSIYDQDTDPSSPEARRQTPEPTSSSEGGPQTQQSPRAATTDPGVGPPSPPASGRAMGVVVPPASGRGVPASSATSSATRGTKDSVELLLEGMGGPRPDRTKTMPQTAGEASAAYHAEHAVRAGRTARDEGRKVLVDTIRLRAPTEDRDAAPRPPADPTFILSAPLGPRVVVATIAGLLVVLAIFAYLNQGPTQATANAQHSATVAAVTAAPAPPVPATETREQPATASETAPAAATPAPSDVAPPPAVVATRPRSGGPRHKNPGDVGEFKTSF